MSLAEAEMLRRVLHTAKVPVFAEDAEDPGDPEEEELPESAAPATGRTTPDEARSAPANRTGEPASERLSLYT